ncbi:MAG: right-handed parallel beta-helix repeat-containing protein [Planctomycetota bacterium]
MLTRQRHLIATALFAGLSTSAAFAAAMPTPPPEAAAIPNPYYVDPNSTAVNPLGRSWADAFPTLQQALAVANSSDWIVVAEGDYFPGTSTTNTFLIPEGVFLRGGFVPGDLPTQPTGADTILSGDIDGDGLPAGNSQHVVTIVGGFGTPTVLQDVTVKQGNAIGTGNAANGAGLHVQNTNLWLLDCVISDHNADNHGAGIYAARGELHLSRCDVANNKADGKGAGVYCDGPVFDAYNCKIGSNIAVTRGGGVFVKGGDAEDVQFMNCYFLFNRADKGSCVLVGSGSEATITNCTMRGNDVFAGGQGVGVFAAAGASALIDNTIIWENSGALPLEGNGSFRVRYSDIEDAAWLAHSATNFFVDPVFVGSVNNCDLDPLSPLKDQGDNGRIALDNVDLDGDVIYNEPTPVDIEENDRVIDGTVEVGACEIL